MSIREIDPVTLKQWMNEGKAILVDVREPEEAARERISEAHNVPLSRFSTDHLPDHDDKIVVYHCVGGKRTAMHGPGLHAATPAASAVYHLIGGIMGWKSAGHAVC